MGCRFKDNRAMAQERKLLIDKEKTERRHRGKKKKRECKEKYRR